MDSVQAPGRQVKGVISSADISTAVAFTLYDISTQETVTLVAGDILVIYLLTVNNGDTATVVSVFDDADADGAVDAGEELFIKSMNAKEQAGFAFTRGFALKRTPKAKAAAGSANTFVEIIGEIIQAAPATHRS